MRKLVLALSLVILPALGAGTGSVAAETSGSQIVQTALQYVGYPYTTVGNSPSEGFSCIGFVSYVYQTNGIPLPDDLAGAMNYAPQVSFNDLLPGDVLYFANTVWPGLSHTAIYLGGGRFVQAEWYDRGVVVSSFTDDPVDGNYWQSHYLGANRPWAQAVPAPVAPAPSGESVTPARPAAPTLPPLREGPRAQVQVSGLNVRLRPSLIAPIKRLVTHGTAVVVLKQSGLWDWVQFPNRSYGWVAGTGLGGRGATAATNRLAAHPIGLTHPVVNGLRVHVRPGLHSTTVTAVYRGAKLLVLQRWSQWTRIETSRGLHGWVASAYLSSGMSRKASRVSAAVTSHRSPVYASGPRVKVTVNVHARPGLYAPVLRLAARGTRVHVLSVSGSWAHVRFAQGGTGWVYRRYVR